MSHLVSTTHTMKDSEQLNAAIQACWSLNVHCCPVSNSDKALSVLVDNEVQPKLTEAIEAIRNPKPAEQA